MSGAAVGTMLAGCGVVGALLFLSVVAERPHLLRRRQFARAMERRPTSELAYVVVSSWFNDQFDLDRDQLEAIGAEDMDLWRTERPTGLRHLDRFRFDVEEEL